MWMPKMLSSRGTMFPAASMCMAAALMVCVVFLQPLLGRRCEAKVKMPTGFVVTGVVVFGDSIVDQGMNNNLLTSAKCNYPPYGQDFTGGKPTGRFCNGKTPSDLIVEELGVKELLPAYFDPNLQSEDLKTGVSFASGGCGFDPLTSMLASSIPLSTQLNYFKEYVGKLKEMVGENETNYIIENALFVVVAGSNDVLNTYFSLPIRRLKYDINAYADLMIEGASNFIQELYDEGARHVVIFGLPPLGCLPSQRTLAGGKARACVEEYNEAAQLVNSKLFAEIDSLNSKLPQSRIVYIDIYNPLLDLIQNPQNYGFDVVDRGCCGTGVIEVSFLCNKYSGTCPDHDKYVFWDSYHPSEKAYEILVHQIIQKYEYNEASQLVNSKLTTEIDSLNNKFPQSKSVYLDIYNPLLDLIQNPQNYGFDVANLGCCGTGVIEVSFLCNKYSGTCPNHDKYVFWDSFHPTEKAYKIIVHQILQKYISRFA